MERRRENVSLSLSLSLSLIRARSYTFFHSASSCGRQRALISQVPSAALQSLHRKGSSLAGRCQTPPHMCFFAPSVVACSNVPAVRLPVVHLLADLLLAVLPHVLRNTRTQLTLRTGFRARPRTIAHVTSGTASGAPSQSSPPRSMLILPSGLLTATTRRRSANMGALTIKFTLTV